MHFLYIIFSESRNRYYIGETHDPEERLIRHNKHTYKNGFTNIAKDWQMVLLKEVDGKEDALLLESSVKG